MLADVLALVHVDQSEMPLTFVVIAEDFVTNGANVSGLVFGSVNLSNFLSGFNNAANFFGNISD